MTVVSSANGTTGIGLVWFVTGTTPLQLVAYDIAHVSAPNMVFNVGTWTLGGAAAQMIEPVIMDGKVYVGYTGHVAVFGL